MSATTRERSAIGRAPSLADGEVHLWRLDLGPDLGRDAEVELDAAEQARAGRFAFGRDRRRFVRARLGLRTLLGAYLDIAPQRVEIRAGTWE